MDTSLFLQMLQECRDNLARRQRSLLRKLGLASWETAACPRDQVSEERRREYRILMQHGEVVWGAIAQANIALYEPGAEDCPGNTVISPDRYFDDHPVHLMEIARSIYDLKDTAPHDPKLAPVAALITDERNNALNFPLPGELTAGHEAYFTSTDLHRGRMPQGVLREMIVPLVISPPRSMYNMLLPLELWGENLRKRWGVLEELLAQSPEQKVTLNVDRPPRTAFPEDDPRRRRPAGVRLTRAAAECIKDIARQQKLGDDFFVQVSVSRASENVGAYQLEVVRQFDATVHRVSRSEGVKLVVAKDQKQRLDGVVIDYMDVGPRKGFLFDDPRPSWPDSNE
jgi:Fe-S cluster assembly iron-binding protein IscA